ncbi:hypothetical protein GCM10009547_17120 [Sporichthya brevicatena]|uniref:Ribosomally synthesized peptide with SipW-like signal peptide n=1 Tax=Sporichthya brevicatena TaxID=171442 RepID=A0ABP3RW79_9ACTN
MRITKKLAGAVAVSAVVALGAGTAFAYWTSSGTGAGTGSVGTNVAFQVAGDLTTPLVLDAEQSWTVTVTNPASFAQTLSTLTVDFEPSDADCNKAWFTLTQPTVSPIDIAAGASQGYTAKLVLNNEAVNQDACKNNSIDFTYTAG